MLHLSPRSLALRTVVSDLQQRLGMVPDAAIVLGSGLGGFVDRMDVTQRIAYHDLPGLPASSAGGHAGEFVLGQFGGKTIIAMAGRLHRYEGHSMQTVTMPVLSMVGLGATQLIVSNAAGGLNPNYRVGDLVCITDHIDWTMPMRDQRQVGNTQRAAAAQTHSERIDPTLSAEAGGMLTRGESVYDQRMIQSAITHCRAMGVTMHCGTYLATLGPTYETRSEYRMMRRLGADLAGMSTVPEVLAVKRCHAETRILAISLVSNVAKVDVPPGQLPPTNHEEVIAAGKSAEESLTKIVAAVLR